MYHKSTKKKKAGVTVVISNRAKKIARERGILHTVKRIN